MACTRFIDLFTGTGAFSEIFETQHGLECVFANDIAESSQTIYRENFNPNVFVAGDLNEIGVDTIPAHDLLCAGFPCQPFSIAGQKRGFEDPRSNVFWKIVEILRHHRPSWILLENVKNLKTHDQGRTFATICAALTDLGYSIRDKVLDTAKITDVPQHRERIYIVGFIDRQQADAFEFPSVTASTRPVADFLEADIPDRFYYTERLRVFPVIREAVTKPVRPTNTVYQYRRHYVRENKNQVCPTLTANMGGGGHNVPLILDEVGIRRLTPRECFNLQGFPHDYKLPSLSDSALYRLAGNAVSVPVIGRLAEALLRSAQKTLG